MANPDFRLIVGADVSASYDQMKSDLKQVISMLDKDPAKIKLGLDSATIGSLRKDVKAALDSSKMNANIGLKFDTGALKEFTDKISNSLSEISKLVSEINQKNLGINLNVSDANSAQEQIAGVRGEVLAYAKALEEAQRIMVDLNNNTSAKNAIKAQGVDFGKAVGTLVNYRTELTRITDSIEKQNTMTGLRIRRDELEQLRTAIVPVLETAQKLGVINVDMSKFVPPEIPASAANTADQIMTALRGIGAVAPAVNEAGQALSEEAAAVENTSKQYDAHQAAVQAAIEAEKLKGNISAEVSGHLSDEASAAEKSAAAAEKDAAASGKAADSKRKASKAAEQSDEEYYAKANRLMAEYYANQERKQEEAEAKKNAQIEEGIRKHNEALDKQSAAEEAAIAARTKREVDLYDGMGRQLEKLGSAANIDRLSAQLDTAKTKMDALGASTAAMQENYSKLEGYLATLNNPGASLEEKKNASEGFRATLSALNEQIRAVSASERELAKAEQEAAKEEKAAADAAKNRENLLTQSYKLLDQVTAAQKNWTKAAKDPATAEAYERLGKTHSDIEKLINELKNADLSKLDPKQVQEFARRLAALKREAAESSSAIKSFGNNVKSYFGNGLSQLKNRLSYTLGFAQIVMKTVQEIKKMISTAVELDTAMNQLQIVTRGSSDDMAAYAKNVSQMAKETAQSTKDLIDATTVYARLGYTMDESASLAKYTAMLQGVGDIDASAAQNAMTAIIKAFGKDVSEIESIMDKMVIVGNNFPISVSQIAEGMNNAGSSLSASGNSLEQSIALLTAANTTVQNISKSSTGLRTIAARIRKTTVELDDLGETIETAKYQKVIDMLTGKGVNLTDNGQYRSTYEILKDIANIWGELSSMERAGIAEQLAGTRQQNVFFSIIEQFREAESAMDRMGDSAGALQESYDIYLNSIQAHVNQLKVAYDALARSFVNSDLAKGIIDVLTKLLEILTSIIDSVGVLGAVLGGGAIITVIKMLSAGTLVSNLASIATFIKEIAAYNSAMAASGGMAWLGMGGLSGAIGAALPYLAAFAAIIGTAAEAGHLYEIAHGLEYATQKVQEEKAAYESLSEQYNTNAERIDALNKAKAHGDITADQYSELLILQAQNEALEAQIALRKEAYDIAVSHQRDVAREKADEILNPKEDEFSTSIEQEIAAYKVAKDFLKTTSNKDRGVSAVEYATDVLEKRIEYIRDIINSLDAEEDAETIKALTAQIQSISDTITGIAPATREALNELEKLQLGGNVKLTVRPVIDTDVLRNAGWTGENDPGDGGATIFSSTISNEDGTVAMNFTPILVDENGNFKGVMSPEELQKYGEEVIAGVREDDLKLKIGATFYGEDAIDRAVEAGKRISELHGTLYEEEISAITQKKKRYQKFQSDFENLTDDTKNAIIRVFKEGAKVEDELTDDRLTKLGEWLEQYGYTYEEAESFFEEMFRKQEELSKSATVSNIADLATIRDELAATSAAWEEYNKATSYEHGDQATQMKAALEKAQADIKAGRIGANSILGAGKLIFSDEQLAAMGYDPAQIANALNNSVLNKLFDGEESEIGIRFANMLRENASALSEFIRVAENGDGTFDIIFDDYEGLANALHLSDDAFAMLLDAMQGFSAQSIRQTSDIQEITTQYLTLKDTLGDAKEAAIELAKYMANQGANEFEAMDVLKNLRNYGYISFNDTELGQIVNQGFATVDKLNQTEAEPKILADDTDFQSKIKNAFDRLRALDGKGATTYVTTVYRQVGSNSGNTGLTGSYSSKGTSTSPSPYEVRTSRASGQKGGSAGEALVNELGPELISDDGKAYIANGGKPGFTRLSEDAIVFTAEDTKKILGTRYSNIPIRAFAQGSPRSSIRDRLIAGSSARAYLGGTEARFTCRCGKTWTYSLISNPRGFTGTCIYCGLQYKDGALISPFQGIITQPPIETPVTIPYYDPYYDTGYGGGGYDYGGGGYGGYSDYSEPPEPSKMDWIAVAIDRVQRAVAALDKVASSAFKKLSTRVNSTKEEMGELTKEIETQQAGYTRYLSEAERLGLSSDLAAKVREGAIDIEEYDEETKKLIDEYSQWYTKALDCKDAIEDLHQSLAQLYMDDFNNTQEDYENRLSETEHIIEMINKDISMAQTRGYIDSADFYGSLAGSTSDQIATLKYELNDLNRYFNEAMASGEIEEGSEAWYEMKQAINDVEESLADANIQLEEYKNKIREINWGYFDYAQSQIAKIGEEANFLINLMSNDKLFQDNGQFNDLGQATAGMHVINYDTYMAQADEYAKEMQRIEQELANDPYNTTLINRRDELLKLQRQSILSAEEEKNAVKDLVAEGIQIELSALQDLIDAYENSLDSAKDLYEYQKKVAEQTGDIAALEKQLSAYQNDTSEENRARVQKLQQQLKDARQNLSETEYDRSISDQKQLLSDLYSEYEEALNNRLDNVDALMAEMINGANANREAIIQTIASVSGDVGYVITDGLNNVMHDQFANYDGMFENITGIHAELVRIYDLIAAMSSASSAVKAYAKGGLIDYTGIAAVHGTPGNPEMVLSAADTAKFLEAAALMRGAPRLSDIRGYGIMSGIGNGGTVINGLSISIPIEHVQDYNDMIAQMQRDPKFDRLVNAITLDRVNGKSNLSKYGVKFG